MCKLAHEWGYLLFQTYFYVKNFSKGKFSKRPFICWWLFVVVSDCCLVADNSEDDFLATRIDGQKEINKEKIENKFQGLFVFKVKKKILKTFLKYSAQKIYIFNALYKSMNRYQICLIKVSNPITQPVGILLCLLVLFPQPK